MKRLFLLTIMWFAAVAGAQGATPWASQCIEPIAVGQTISGRLESTDCSIYYDNQTTELYYTDVYAFSGTQGQQIAITMTSTAVDAWLELHTVNDQDDEPLEQDDDGGGGRNARIPANSGYYRLPATGTYYISASTAMALQTGAYTITIAAPAGPFASRCITPIEIGQTVSGTLESTDCWVSYGENLNRYYTDVFSFSGTRGQQIAIAMDSAEVDTWLELHTVNDVDATALYVGDAVGGRNARIPYEPGYYTLPATGTYYIWANTVFSNQTGAYTLKLTTTAEMTATEFYHPAFDHYFITAYPEEAASLAAGNLPPWIPTGRTFKVWGSAGTSIDKVWRFFSASFAPQSSHFYTNNPLEAQMLESGNVWQREAEDAFYMMASPTGACPQGARALYRLYNDGKGGAPNHRYTIDPDVRAQMIAMNWVPEGNGADGVFACVPL